LKLLFIKFDYRKKIILKITKEVKIGSLVISALALVIFGYNFLQGKNILTKNKVFYALYNNVEGLDTSSNVTINGLVVGSILDIDFTNESGQLRVTFSVENDFEFGENSVAKIYSTGIIGGKNLAILPEKKPKTMAKNKQILSSVIEPSLLGGFSEKLDPLQKKLSIVLDETTIMISSINKVLNEENTGNISKSLKTLTNTLSSLNTTSESVKKLIANNENSLSLTIDNFKVSSENINKFSKEISKIEVSKLSNDLEKIINDFSLIAKKLDSNTGTAGKLINDPTVYDNLDRATRQLDLLLQDVKLNPKRYVHFSVFGKKGNEYEKPKDSLK